MIYACDRQWWLQHIDRVGKLCEGELWTTSPSAAKAFRLNELRSEPGGGVSDRKGFIRRGGNSGFQAVGMALHFGAARVILLGFDMQFTTGRKHWHGDHPDNLGNPLQARFKDWIRNFEELSVTRPGMIINASRESALGCFPRMVIDESLAQS